MMPLKLRPPPADHDISRQFEPVDRRNIGGNGCFNAGVFVVRHKRSGKKYVEKKISLESIHDGTGRAPSVSAGILMLTTWDSRVRNVRFERT